MDKNVENKDFSKEIETKIEQAIERNIPKFVGPLVAGVVIAIMMLLINVYYNSAQFLTEDFGELLPILNFSFVVGIVLNLSQMFIQSKAYARITTIISNIIFFYIAYQVWTVFPIDTSFFGDSAVWENLIRVVLGFMVVATALGTISEFGKLLEGEKED